MDLRTRCSTTAALLGGLVLGFAQGQEAKPGLLARGTDGERSATFVVPTPNFSLAAPDSIHPQLKPAFEARWSGTLNILRADKYTLHANARVLVDGQEVQGKSVQLDAGLRSLSIEYKRQPGVARLQLEWESGHFRREPVPPGVLGHREEPAELAATRKIEQGRRLVEDMNCAACHKTANSLPDGRRAPDLSTVGDRATQAWIFTWLDNPKHFRKDAAMPAVTTSGQDRADMAAYLSTRRSKGGVGALPPDSARAEKGGEMFSSLGCAGCHDDQRNSLAGIGSKYSAAALARFLVNPLAVDPSGRMPDMALSHGEAESLALHLAGSKNTDFEKPSLVGNPDRGRSLLAMTGCAACHRIEDERGVIASTLVSPPMEKLKTDAGCLAETPPQNVARYGLGPEERASIAAFLAQPDCSPAPVQDFHRLTTQLNCNACHELYGPAKLAFPVNQGPPSLTESGYKLRESWLSAVLLSQKRVRPWMAARMPHFGEAAAPLVEQFAEQAGAESGEGSAVPVPSKAEAESAVKLLGSSEGGLACINCHDYRGQKSQGEMRGPDLIEMNARIRTDWLRRWLWEPQRVQPGTAMPSFFGSMTPAKADEMINTIITALASGRDMPDPPGWGELGASYTLTVGERPLLVRTFLPNSHPRSIAVGLPRGQSYCFDAEFGFLRYAWSGAFLDVKPVWTDRGGQPAIPVGTVWFNSPSTLPLRLGSPESQAKANFRGYKLEQHVPVFLYDVDGVAVREKITVTEDGKGLVREFELGSTTRDVWFVAPEGQRLNLSASVGAFVNGRLKVPGGAKVKFSVTIKPQ